VSEDPTAEEIVGEENVVDVGSATEGHVEEEREQPAAQGYKCSLAGCSFQTSHLSEMEEHVSGTGHGGYATETIGPADPPSEPVQPELFSTPGVVHRDVRVPFPDDVINEKRARLASLYQNALDIREEKKAADDDFNAQLKSIDTDMQALARVLRTPWTYENADCEWKILDNENARGLYRLDTGEMIEKQPLTAEDYAALQEKAAQENAAPAEQETVSAS